MRNVQRLGNWNVQNMPEELGPDTRQVLGHGRQVQGECTGGGRQTVAWHEHGTSAQIEKEKDRSLVEKAQAALQAAQEAGMAKEIIKHLMTEISKRKDEEHKMKLVDKHREAAKQALTRTAAMMPRRRMPRRRMELEEVGKRMEQTRAELHEVFKEYKRCLQPTQKPGGRSTERAR